MGVNDTNALAERGAAGLMLSLARCPPKPSRVVDRILHASPSDEHSNSPLTCCLYSDITGFVDETHRPRQARARPVKRKRRGHLQGAESPFPTHKRQ